MEAPKLVEYADLGMICGPPLSLGEYAMNRAIFTVARLLTSALLLWALARHSIGYYTILRVITCSLSAYAVYLTLQWKQVGWAFVFGAIAILFQPIFTFRMTRQTWQYVDVAVAVMLLASIPLLWRPESSRLSQ
jgi:Family of unknown function (DUF6804)